MAKTYFAEKAIEKAQKDAAELAASYDVPPSAVIWAGGNKYIIVKDGKQIYI